MRRSLFFLIVLAIVGVTSGLSQKVFSQDIQKAGQVNNADSVSKDTGKTAEYVKGITPGRARALAGTVIGLIGLILALWSKNRSAKKTARIGLALAITGFVLSVIHLSTSAGAVFGSGSGKAGAIAGLLFGLGGIIVGGIVLRRQDSRTS